MKCYVLIIVKAIPEIVGVYQDKKEAEEVAFYFTEPYLNPPVSTKIIEREFNYTKSNGNQTGSAVKTRAGRTNC